MVLTILVPIYSWKTLLLAWDVKSENWALLVSFSTKEQRRQCLSAADNLVALPLLLATENICEYQTTA